jgi:hypothetical protein
VRGVWVGGIEVDVGDGVWLGAEGVGVNVGTCGVGVPWQAAKKMMMGKMRDEKNRFIPLLAISQA